ncbi:MAG: hypothetical protein IPL61_29260 [Myxococcales bacterium]|nr:hypothetical protein [Myxococcales bacterium]
MTRRDPDCDTAVVVDVAAGSRGELGGHGSSRPPGRWSWAAARCSTSPPVLAWDRSRARCAVDAAGRALVGDAEGRGIPRGPLRWVVPQP